MLVVGQGREERFKFKTTQNSILMFHLFEAFKEVPFGTQTGRDGTERDRTEHMM